MEGDVFDPLEYRSVLGIVDRRVSLAYGEISGLAVEATGQQLDLLPLLDRTNCRPAVETFVTAWARRMAALAAQPGLELAEGFRRELASDWLS